MSEQPILNDLNDLALQWSSVTDSSGLELPIFDAPTADSLDAFADVAAAEFEGIAADQTAAQLAEFAQAEADVAIEMGDYEAAAQLREVAEDAADSAADGSMLHGATSDQLAHAADHQEQAVEASEQEAMHAREGDYEAARDDAADAAWNHQVADSLSGGEDHSIQAQAEYDHMDWAVWNESAADEFASDAVDYAEQGNIDAMSHSLDTAADYQAQADLHGDLGEHGGPMQDVYQTPELQDYDTTYDTTDTFDVDVADYS